MQLHMLEPSSYTKELHCLRGRLYVFQDSEFSTGDASNVFVSWQDDASHLLMILIMNVHNQVDSPVHLYTAPCKMLNSTQCF